jgi:hypothetical protein
MRESCSSLNFKIGDVARPLDWANHGSLRSGKDVEPHTRNMLFVRTYVGGRTIIDKSG